MRLISWLSDHAHIIVSIVLGVILSLLLWVESQPPIETRITLESGYKYVSHSVQNGVIYISQRPMSPGEYPEAYVIKPYKSGGLGGQWIYYIMEVAQ